MSHSRYSMRGLYAITEPAATESSLAARVRLALEGGARIIQYRDKSPDTLRRRAEARALRRLCGRFDVPFLINDDVELAAACGAGGVHLGEEDVPLAEARQRLGDRAIIGISCYNRLGRALEAEAAGADYVAFGRFFPSASKPQAVQADPALLREARSRLRIPIVAIGGITPENGGPLIEAGADMLAVIQGVFRASDIRAAAARFAQLFEQQEEPTR